MNRRSTNVRSTNTKGSKEEKGAFKVGDDSRIPPNCPKQLRPLFMTDDNVEYIVPFKDPGELTDIFFSLEEQNLKLIQQQQDIEQTIENKNKDYERLELRKKEELALLEQRKTEVVMKTNKTKDEK